MRMVFLLKQSKDLIDPENANFARHTHVMNLKEIKPGDMVDVLDKETSAEFGLICLKLLTENSSDSDLSQFARKHGIITESKVYSKTGYLLNVALHFYKEYKTTPELEQEYTNALEYMGKRMLEDEIFQDFLLKFDLISKREIIDIFADYCADMGISVYDATDI